MPAPSSPPYVGPVAHSSGNGNKPIVRIVMHCTVGSDAKGSTGTVAYFKSQAARGSAHYVVDARQILQCAYDSVVCWHAPPNSHSLGYELCCSLTNQGKGHWERDDHQAMLKIAAKSVAENCLAYGLPIRKMTVAQVRAGEEGICGHHDVSLAFGQSSHWDPGPYFPWNQFIGMVKAEAAKITGQGDTGDTEPEEGKMSAKDVEDGLSAYGRRFFDPNTGTGAKNQAALLKAQNDTTAAINKQTTVLERIAVALEKS